MIVTAVIKASGKVVQRFAVHVNDEGVTHARDHVTIGAHQHPRALDRDVTIRVTEKSENR